MRRQLLLVTVMLVSVVAGAAPAAGQETVTLTVSVVSDSGTPIGGATIDATWDDGSATATTAGNGKAFIDVPRGADVELSAESDDFIRNRPLVVENAESGEVTLEVVRKGQYAVRITDTDGPVSNVQVSLSRGGTTIVEGRTNDNGEFTSPIVEQGEYVLAAFKSGYFRNVTRVEVQENTSEKLSMRRGTVDVQFRVRDDHFEPPQTLTGAQVNVDGVGTQRTTGGAVTFTLPVNTRYQVSATKDGYVTNQTAFFIGTNPGTQTLTIQREPNLTVVPSNERVVVGERLTVEVTNAYSEPVSNASVLVDGEQVAMTDDEGVARAVIETEGEHEVTAQLDGVTSAAIVVEGIAVDDSTPTATATATATTTGTPEPGPQVPLPGFTPVTVVLALLALAFVALLGRRFR
ncbi:carboxypeptidase-like regulatory domain-containing protein [Halorarius litoreus]|uniref:carboxypeptidase-like regulatory domain-containing protein n=1 Tax=Halorarius litoreus TaxID=2962676 RepID=UPI0020CD23FB|nr:carboxypeptidase-like regulatory domain-containing protein [Halorarius litoreus]